MKIDKKVVYDISWSQDQGNVFVTTLGSNVIALDAHNYDIVGRDCMFQD